MQWQNRMVGQEDVAPDQLLANPLNWRIHSLDQQTIMTEVLGTVGWIDRVKVNRATGCVVDGHMRVMLAMKHDQLVPVEYVDLTPDEEAFMLAMYDRITEMAGTDQAKTRELLAAAHAFMQTNGPNLKQTQNLLAKVARTIPTALALADDDDDPLLTPEDFPDAKIRMVQLFLTDETHGPFIKWVNELAPGLGTTTITDTVYALVKAAYDAR